MSSWIDVHALWQIVVVGVVAGAGLPALFAVGLRALAAPASGQHTLPADSTRVIGGNRLGMVIAAVCFAVVLAGIAWGVYMIVDGS